MYEPKDTKNKAIGQVDLKSYEMFLLAQITHDEMLENPDKKESQMNRRIKAARNGNEVQRQAMILRMKALRPNKYDEKTIEWFKNRRKN